MQESRSMGRAAGTSEHHVRIVLGLGAAFIVVFLAGPAKQFGWFRAAPAQPPAASASHVKAPPVWKGLSSHHLEEQINRMESQVDQDRRTRSEAPTAMTYTAHELRDPLKDLLPAA